MASAWLDVVFDRDVPEATRVNIGRAVDTTSDLLTKYKVITREPIQIIVTTDLESYIQARMFYLKESRTEADKLAPFSAGVSSGGKPVIIIRGSPLLNSEPQEAFRVIPHEVFHQVQRQYGRTDTVTWLKEGAPEVFRMVAQEAAGFGRVNDYLGQSVKIVRRAPVIPDAREIATFNYATWTTLMQKNYPVYDMAVLMADQLSQGNGFENIIFFYQMLHMGVDREKAFRAAFRVPMSWFLTDMNGYFTKLRGGR
jgi:hypothetical protein